MQKLLNVCKEDAESLSDHITHVNSATNELVALTPATLTMKKIIDDIGTHTAISGLDHAEYVLHTESETGLEEESGMCQIGLGFSLCAVPSHYYTSNILE
jgi:hypothetical protein